MRALLTACFVVALSAGIVALERPHIVTAYQTMEVAAAWPPHVVATIPRVHLLPRLEHGWQPMPWAQWTAPRARARRLREIGGPSPVGQAVRTGLWIELALALLALLMLLRKVWGPLWFVVGRTGRLTPSDAHGAAQWATAGTIRRLRPRHGAAPFVLGRVGRRLVALPETLHYLNVLLVGRPGAGKSTLLIGNLLRETGRRSLVMTDPKGELWDTTSAHLSHTGMRALRLDFYEAEGAGYNPLAHVHDATEALLFAQTWLANTRRQEGEDGFWDDTCRLLLQAAILHLNAVYADAGGATLPQLAHYLSSTDAAAMQKELAESPDPTARAAASGFLRVIQGNERLASSVFVGLPLRFMALQDARVRAVTSHDDIDIAAMGRATGPATALYVILTRGREDIIRPLTACLFGQIFGGLIDVANAAPGRALPRPVLCVIDEAGTVGAIANLPQWLATLRSARVGCVLAFQALSQATTIYGPEGRADIEENCQTHLLFGGAGFASAAWMSAGIGETTVVQRSAGKGRERTRVFAGTGNESMSETSAPLLRPEQITELRPGTLLVRIAHHRPLRVMVAPWYRSWRLKRRAGRLIFSKESHMALAGHPRAMKNGVCRAMLRVDDRDVEGRASLGAASPSSSLTRVSRGTPVCRPPCAEHASQYL